MHMSMKNAIYKIKYLISINEYRILKEVKGSKDMHMSMKAMHVSLWLLNHIPLGSNRTFIGF